MALAPLAILAINLGVAAGGMAAQYLLRPKIKQQPTDIGKNDDIRITGSDYGAFIPRAWGRMRLGGQIFLSTGISHYIIDSPSSGGKGAPPAPATRTHVYTTSLGVLVCRGEIASFRQVWADNNLIVSNGLTASEGFYEAENAVLSGADVETDADASGGEYVQNLGNGNTATFTLDLDRPGDPPEPNVPVPYTRLSFNYRSETNLTAIINCDGTDYTVNFPSTDGDWLPLTIHVDGHCGEIIYGNPSDDAPDLDKIGVYYYFVNEHLPESSYRLSGLVNPNIGYPTELDDPSEFYNYKLEYDEATGIASANTPVPGEVIRFYTGTETQTPDAKIISWLDSRYGAGEGERRASAMRGLAYVFFQDRTLKNGRVDNFTFEIDSGSNTVNQVLEDLLSDVGFTSGYYNLTATSGLTQIGFLEHTRTSRRNLIEYLARYHQFRIAEIDGKIKTISENTVSLATIDAKDLRAHIDSEEMPAFDAEVVRKEEHLFPRSVSVSIMNPALEYHNESVPARAFGTTSATEDKEYTFPIADTPENAKKKAEILLLKEYAENKAFELSAMPNLAKYSVGDILTVPIGGIDQVIRIEKKQETLPLGKIRIQAVSTETNIYPSPSDRVNTSRRLPPNQEAFVNFPRNSVAVVIQSLPIVEKDKGRLGVYIVISGRGRGNWENCALYREIAGEYVFQQIIGSPSPLGICPIALPAHPSNPDCTAKDETNELDIYFYDDIELESVTTGDIERFPTVNLLRVGDEWLQFETVVPLAISRDMPYRSAYTVSNLWRGRFATDGTNATHNDNEYASVVTPALRFVELEDGDIGETVNLKAVTNGQSVDNAPVTTFTFAPLSIYTIGNHSADLRVFDADNVTIDELADVVATVISDTRF